MPNLQKTDDLINLNPNWSVAELQVTYKPQYDRTLKINSYLDARDLFMDIWDSDLLQIQEQFYTLFLNRANNVIAYRCISAGSAVNTVVDIKFILVLCLRIQAQSIIIAHNHPSGSLKPSSKDILLTNKIIKAARMMDIDVLDHLIIIGSGECFSLMEEKMMGG